MVSDPIGDMLIQIKNASMVGRSVIALPYSKLKMALCEILIQEGYILSAEKVEAKPIDNLKIELKYNGKHSAITDVKRISKPGLRVYIDSKKIPSVLGGLGISVLSTSKGVMSGKEAKRDKLGGEVLCYIW